MACVTVVENNGINMTTAKAGGIEIAAKSSSVSGNRRMTLCDIAKMARLLTAFPTCCSSTVQFTIVPTAILFVVPTSGLLPLLLLPQPVPSVVGNQHGNQLAAANRNMA